MVLKIFVPILQLLIVYQNAYSGEIWKRRFLLGLKRQKNDKKVKIPDKS